MQGAKHCCHRYQYQERTTGAGHKTLWELSASLNTTLETGSALCVSE
jgi:hypothetical protein